MSFNYAKAYCVQAVPAFNDLPDSIKKANLILRDLVGDLHQGKDLAIPLKEEIYEIFKPLKTEDIARLSRVSYFLGHWYPGFIGSVFNNKKGECWKVSNCCDQILRERLNLPKEVQIHGGKFRVTFQNYNCWLWEEFGLVTQYNLDIYKNCKLKFGEMTLHESVNILKEQCGELWGDVEEQPDNELYKEYLVLQKEKEIEKRIANFKRKIHSLEEAKIDAQTEIDFLFQCDDLGVSTDNVIFYKHTSTFCFGWNKKLSKEEIEDYKEKLTPLLEETDYQIKFNIEFKE